MSIVSYVLGIDPGSKSPGFAKARFDGRAVLWSTEPRTLATGASAVVCEAQYPGPKASRQSLITLGFSAGALAYYYAAIHDCPAYVAKPRAWRGVYGRGMAGKSKKAFLASVFRDYASELGERPESDDDADAKAIALAFILNPEAFTLHKQKGIS